MPPAQGKGQESECHAPDLPRRLVIGIGNPDRGDDAAGRLVARALRRIAPPCVTILEHDGDAGSLLGLLRPIDSVWLADASCSGALPGTLRRLDCGTGDRPPPSPTASSHGMGVAEAIALASALESLPRRCVVYAIEGRDFAPGAPPSLAVTDAAACAAARIAAEVIADKTG